MFSFSRFQQGLRTYSEKVGYSDAVRPYFEKTISSCDSVYYKA